MDYFQAFFLGLVQGLTEFLPISSSGHLVIFQKLVGIKEHSIPFDVAVHLGTLLSIFTLYFAAFRQIVLELIRFPIKREMSPGVRLTLLVILGSIPTAIIGFSLKDFFESLFFSPQAVGIFLSITGVLLFFTRGVNTQQGQTHISDMKGLEEVKPWKAIVIGIAQGAAIAPGVSRSGTTIATGLFLGLSRTHAALFSFMLSVPAILGAGVLQLKDVTAWGGITLTTLSIGFFSAYLFGLLGLWGVLHLVRKGRLEFFSYYLWIVGAAVFFLL